MLGHMPPARPADAQLGIVVVHYRDERVLEECLERIAGSAKDAEVVVVDTSGNDAAAAVVGCHARARRVPTPNHSYAYAANVGFKALDTPLLALMNADTWVEGATFTDLEAALRAHPEAGVAGPLATDRHGAIQDLGLPYRVHYARLRRAPRHVVTAPWLSGCLQLVRRAVLDAVGGYDPSLRFFNEDLEFCLRARRAGFACLLVDTPVVHLGGTSTPSDPAFHVEGRRGGYTVSRRYLAPSYRRGHRAFLGLEASLGMRFARDAAGRAAHERMATMVRTGDFDTSPFGATLDASSVTVDTRP